MPNDKQYAICEPRQYDVLARYETQEAADKSAVRFLKIEHRRRGSYPINRLACVIVERGDQRDKLPEESASTVYRWLPGKRVVEVERKRL